MPHLHIVGKADLDVYYEAESARYDPALLARFGVNKEVFVACYGHCPSIGFAADGKPIGGVLIDGDRLHIAVLSEYYGRWAFLLRPTLQRCFAFGDRFFADIEIDNDRCLRFMDAVLWRRVKCTETHVTYEIANYGRMEARKCLEERAPHERDLS